VIILLWTENYITNTIYDIGYNIKIIMLSELYEIIIGQTIYMCKIDYQDEVSYEYHIINIYLLHAW